MDTRQLTAMTVTVEVVHDYVLPDGVESVAIFIRCTCQVEPQAIPLHMLPEGIAFLRSCKPPGDLPVQSWRCRHCKRKVKITARMLYLAA